MTARPSSPLVLDGHQADAVKRFHETWNRIGSQRTRTMLHLPEENASCDDDSADDYDEDAVAADDISDASIEVHNEKHRFEWKGKYPQGELICKESFYTDIKITKANRKGERLIYDFCSPQELKSFVLARGLHDPFPAGHTLSYHYLAILNAADEGPAPFRFLDLAPEIRVLVYDQALAFDEARCPCGQLHKNTCTPQILATCQQVYNEANDLLYTSNTVRCVLTIKFLSPHMPFATPVIQPTLRIHRTTLVDKEMSKFENVIQLFTSWPQFLLRVRNLQIDLQICNCQGHAIRSASTKVFRLIEKILLSLSSFLMEEHCLESLSLQFFTAVFCDELDLEVLMYPVRRLRGIPSVQIAAEGNLESDECDEIASSIVTEMKTTDKVCNTLKWYQLVRTELQTYAALSPYYKETDKLYNVVHEARFEHALKAIKEVDNLLHYMGHDREEVFEDLEPRILKKLAEARDMLLELKKEDLEKRMQAFNRAHEELEQYSKLTAESGPRAEHEKPGSSKRDMLVTDGVPEGER